MYNRQEFINVSVSSLFPEKGRGTAIFGSLRVGGGAWYGEYSRDPGKGIKAGEGCRGTGAAGVIG